MQWKGGGMIAVKFQSSLKSKQAVSDESVCWSERADVMVAIGIVALENDPALG